MRLRWYGQSAFALTGERHTVFIDPFGDLSGSSLGWRYPPISGARADLLLVTHEHRDHNHVAAVGGEPHLVRSSAGTHETPLGEVVAVASEHDTEAGIRRGANTIVRFTLDGLRVAHFGDFGQAELRHAQREAIGDVDVLLLPVGGGPTVGGESAAAIVRELRPRLVVGLHYGNDAVSFLGPPEPFLEALGSPRVERLSTSEAEVEPLLGESGAPTVVLFAPPMVS